MTVKTRLDPVAVARELAKAIEATDEIRLYRDTEQAVLDDPGALELIREYEAAKRAVKRSKQLAPEEQMARLERFMAVEERFNNHTVIQNYWNARTQLDAFLDRVNAVVTFPFTGEDAPKVKGGGCSSGGGGCSTGGGCGCS